MRVLLFVVAGAMALLSAGAGAAETREVAVKRNTEARIGTYVRYFGDSCRAADTADARITQQPTNGIATLSRGPITMPKGRCEGVAVTGVIVSYRPKPGFVGRDRVVFSRPVAIYEERPPSFDEIVYDITVQ